jgi:hypothetical protein
MVGQLVDESALVPEQDKEAWLATIVKLVKAVNETVRRIIGSHAGGVVPGCALLD